MSANSKDSMIVTGLNDVLKFLLNKHDVKDDSILHSLADLIDKYLNDVQTYKLSGLSDFLEEICHHCAEHDPVLVGFALHFATRIVKKDALAHIVINTIRELLDSVWTNKPVFNDVAVRTAFYKCVLALIEQKSGLYWLVSSEKEYLDHGFVELSAGASIFLQKAVSQVLSVAIATCIQSSNEEDKLVKGYQDKLLLKTLEHIHNSTKQGACSRSVNSRLVSSCIQLLEGVCQRSHSVTVACVKRPQFIEDIQHIILTSEKHLSDQAISLLMVCLKSKSEAVLTVADKLLQELLDRGNRALTRRLAVAGLKSDINDIDKFVNILVDPIQRALAIDSQPAKGNNQVMKQWDSRSDFTSDICFTISAFCHAKVSVPALISQLFALTLSQDQGANGSESTLGYILDNKKIQRICLEYFLQVTDYTEAEREQIIASIFTLMKSPNLDSVMYTSCVQCLLSHITSIVENESLAETLSSILQHQLCALQWELRDTTLEFLANVLDRFAGEAMIVKWYINTRLHAHIWSCVSDGESYVRASALMALSHILTSSDLWTGLREAINLSENELVEKIVTIFTEDTEAFARRSAGKFLSQFFFNKLSSTLSINTRISCVMQQAVNDFDWEVKLVAVNFLEKHIVRELAKCDTSSTSEVPEYAQQLKGTSVSGPVSCFQSVLKKLYTDEYLPSLLKAVDDYDQSVSREACQVLKKIQKTLINLLGTRGVSFPVKYALGNISEDSSKKSVIIDEQCTTKQILEKGDCSEPTANGTNGDHGSTLQTVEQIECSGSIGAYLHLNHDSNCSIAANIDTPVSAGDPVTCEGLIECIDCILMFDVSVRSTETGSCCDYIANPLSLIQDILSYADKPEDDNNVDCY